MSWAEDKFDATRQSEDDEDYGDEWHCHDCGLGGRTPWDPTVGCPHYPCHAFKPAEMKACPICKGWVL